LLGRGYVAFYWFLWIMAWKCEKLSLENKKESRKYNCLKVIGPCTWQMRYKQNANTTGNKMIWKVQKAQDKTLLWHAWIKFIGKESKLICQSEDPDKIWLTENNVSNTGCMTLSKLFQLSSFKYCFLIIKILELNRGQKIFFYLRCWNIKKNTKSSCSWVFCWEFHQYHIWMQEINELLLCHFCCSSCLFNRMGVISYYQHKIRWLVSLIK